MKRPGIVVLMLLFILPATSFRPAPGNGNTSYPAPKGIDNMLFYLQRTVNSNTIVYEPNLNANGSINEADPIKVYWIKYDDGGKIHPLNYIQRKYAYGVETKMIDKEKKTFSFQFVSYDKRKFYLIKSEKDNKYRTYGYYNNKLQLLNNIFIHTDGGSFWVPNVTAIEVKMKDPFSAGVITEMIKP
jgi:hypothetical protein